MAKPTKKELEELALQEAEAKAPASVNKDIMRAIASAKMSLKKKFGDDLFSEKKIEPIPSISTGSAKKVSCCTFAKLIKIEIVLSSLYLK